jgi:hypothetical protein
MNPIGVVAGVRTQETPIAWISNRDIKDTTKDKRLNGVKTV